MYIYVYIQGVIYIYIYIWKGNIISINKDCLPYLFWIRSLSKARVSGIRLPIFLLHYIKVFDIRLYKDTRPTPVPFQKESVAVALSVKSSHFNEEPIPLDAWYMVIDKRM